MWAVTRGPVAVQLLLERGANAKVADARGFTPLMLAAGGGQLNAMRALIAAGADVNALSTHGSSALRDGVRSGNPAAVRLLLNSGAKLLITPRNTNRMTFIAVTQEDTAMLELLLDRGLDPNQSAAGYTGLMSAAMHGLEGPL